MDRPGVGMPVGMPEERGRSGEASLDGEGRIPTAVAGWELEEDEAEPTLVVPQGDTVESSF